MKLKKVKSIIYKTECADLLSSGSYCSEPIMTLDKSGKLIDNYFVYSRSNDLSKIQSPEISFGIYTNDEVVAYINNNVADNFDAVEYMEYFEDEQSMKNAYEEYSELFSSIRNMIEKKENKNYDTIKKYLDMLECVSGKILFGFYKILYSDFFTWALN